MIDQLARNFLDRLWAGLGKPVAALGVSPNAITLLGALFVFASCVWFVFHRNHFLFGLCLSFSFTADALDGAVARLTGQSTRYGGYLDAIVDRYQEALVLLVLAWVNDIWAVAFFAITGAFLISYAKARVALEITTSNNDWPDFFERLERLAFLCAILVFEPLIDFAFLEQWGGPVPAGLVLYALLAHGTALQRFLRARRLLLRADSENPKS
jgi:phosphatidylglycerophosphate synthase